MVEHPPVITTGRRAVADLAGVGCDIVATERGGLATYHGPGQLVGYLILDVAGRGGSVRGTVFAIEAGVIAWLHAQGVGAARRPGFPGVWVGRDKICALGLHFSRGVSMHGFALNLDPDLSMYERFMPCGVRDGGVTSFGALQANAPTPGEAALDVADRVLAAFVDTLRPRD